MIVPIWQGVLFPDGSLFVGELVDGSNSLCAPGWSVCTGAQLWGAEISFEEATGFGGCFVGDAAQDSAGCFATCTSSVSVSGVGRFDERVDPADDSLYYLPMWLRLAAVVNLWHLHSHVFAMVALQRPSRVSFEDPQTKPVPR